MEKFVEIKGIGEVLRIYEDKISIVQVGFMGFLLKGSRGTKTIPYSSIMAVQYRKPGLLTNGYIQFTIPGGKEATGGLYAATQDENTFMFRQPQLSEMDRAKAFIEEKLLRNSKHGRSAGLGDEIFKLVKLLENGQISAAEFEKLKEALLKNVG
jgi:hypothetical protein